MPKIKILHVHDTNTDYNDDCYNDKRVIDNITDWKEVTPEYLSKLVNYLSYKIRPKHGKYVVVQLLEEVEEKELFEKIDELAQKEIERERLVEEQKRKRYRSVEQREKELLAKLKAKYEKDDN